MGGMVNGQINNRLVVFALLHIFPVKKRAYKHNEITTMTLARLMLSTAKVSGGVACA